MRLEFGRVDSRQKKKSNAMVIDLPLTLLSAFGVTRHCNVVVGSTVPEASQQTRSVTPKKR